MITMTPMYNTKTFTQIYEDQENFLSDYNEIGLGGIDDEKLVVKLFYLLYAKYGNNPIANKDINQFKYKLFSTVFMYGPTWAKRLDIQKILREIPEPELLSGSRAIYNHAFNPSTSPSTATLDELTHINEQNTTNYKKSKMDAYMQLWDLLDIDVTNEFLNKFKGLFKQFVLPEDPLLYESEV